MESKLAKTAVEPHPMPNPSADDSGCARMGSTGTPRSPVTVLHATLEMQRMYSQWMASKALIRFTGTNAGTTPAAAQPPPETRDGSWWEATLPVAGRNLAPSMQNLSPGFIITELRGIPKEGLDHFVLASSCNGKPLYGAYVTDSQGAPRLQQLFEFSQTASNAGVFLPVPTAGGHFRGVYGVEYVRHSLRGSIASLPLLLRCPPPPTSVDRDVSLNVRRALLSVVRQSAQADTADILPPKSVTDTIIDSPVSPLPSPLQAVTLGASAESSLITPPLSNSVQSLNDVRHALAEIRPSLSNAPAPSSNTCERMTPLTTRHTPPQGGAPEPAKLPTMAPIVTTLAAALSKPPPQHLPEYCHPCSLCASCKDFWGITGLPKEFFKDDPFHWQKDPKADIAILSSARTALRKRKWKQSRHGPKSKTSEYRGVNLYMRTWKWESHIWFNREQLYLGASLTNVHAAKVYDRAALFLFGPDAHINFKPEIYQGEYDFIQRLSFSQMVVYLRRESRQNGEEVKYPGVTKAKGGMFNARYRPKKNKKLQEYIGVFKTQDEAARAILHDAQRRQDFVHAEEILSIRHLRTIKPAPGKFTVKRRVRAFCIMAALKRMGIDPFTFRNTPARSRRAAKSNAKPSSETDDETDDEDEVEGEDEDDDDDDDEDALLAEEAATARLKRQTANKTRKAKAAAAEKANADTSPTQVSQEAPPSQETKATTVKRKYTPRKPKVQAQEIAPKRIYTRRKPKTQEDESATKRGAKKALPTEDSIDPVPVTEGVEAPPSQGTKAAPAKRKYAPWKPKAQEKVASPKRGTKRAPAEEVITPAPVAKAPPCQCKRKTPAKSKNTIRTTPTRAAKSKRIAEATSPPPVRKSARLTAAVTRRPRQEKAMVQEYIAVDSDSDAPSSSSSPRSPRSRRTARPPGRCTWIASLRMLPNAIPQYCQCPAEAVQSASAPPEQSTISIADSLIVNPPPQASESTSGSLRGAQMLMDCAGMCATSAYRGSKPPPSSLDSPASGYVSSSCASFQSLPVSKRSKPPQVQTRRQFQEVCERLLIHQRTLMARVAAMSNESNSPAAAVVFRPVARRVPPTNWAPLAAISDASCGARDCSGDVLPLGEENGGYIYVDLSE